MKRGRLLSWVTAGSANGEGGVGLGAPLGPLPVFVQLLGILIVRQRVGVSSGRLSWT